MRTPSLRITNSCLRAWGGTNTSSPSPEWACSTPGRTAASRRHYLEHEWRAEQGGYSFEPPGDIHTLEVPDGVEEMITLFPVTGAYIYVDPDGNAMGVEDVFTKLEATRKHYEAVGLGAEYVDRFVR